MHSKKQGRCTKRGYTDAIVMKEYIAKVICIGYVQSVLNTLYVCKKKIVNTNCVFNVDLNIILSDFYL